MRVFAGLATITLLLFFSPPVWSQESPAKPEPLAGRRIADVPILDAHLHYAGEHPTILEWMTRNDVKLLNIAVGGLGDGWRGRADVYRRLATQHPDRFAWCTSFTLPDFQTPDYATRVIRQLEVDFLHGAVGCKIWKSVGMSLQRPSGQYVQMDDPIFDEIYSWLASHGHTLVVHIAEPIACWQPLDENNPYRSYYSKNPQWHMHGRTDRPHHSDIIAARDNVIERYPTLRVVGAHLGSLEYDVGELAKRFEKYPNFAVDTSGRARIGDLGRQDRDKVRAFFVKYQDRMMFGSDRSAARQLQMNARQLQNSFAELRDALQLGWDYYATDRTVMVKDQPCRGLALSHEVLRKLFAANAKRWYPGLQ